MCGFVCDGVHVCVRLLLHGCGCGGCGCACVRACVCIDMVGCVPVWVCVSECA